MLDPQLRDAIKLALRMMQDAGERCADAAQGRAVGRETFRLTATSLLQVRLNLLTQVERVAGPIGEFNPRG